MTKNSFLRWHAFLLFIIGLLALVGSLFWLNFNNFLSPCCEAVPHGATGFAPLYAAFSSCSVRSSQGLQIRFVNLQNFSISIKNIYMTNAVGMNTTSINISYTTPLKIISNTVNITSDQNSTSAVKCSVVGQFYNASFAMTYFVTYSNGTRLVKSNGTVYGYSSS